MIDINLRSHVAKTIDAIYYGNANADVSLIGANRTAKTIKRYRCEPNDGLDD
jgi:hypothetical protein